MKRHNFQPQFAVLDAATPGFSIFIDRALNYIMAEIFNTETPPLKGRLFVPTRATAPAGAKSITYKQYTRAGIAAWITNYGQDLPTASVWVKEFTTQIYALGASYKYTIFDLMAAMMANGPNAGAAGGPPLNLDMELAAGALLAIQKKLDNVARVGTSDTDINGLAASPNLGLIGLLNIPAATIFTPANGLQNGTQAWSGKTPDEIVADVAGAAASQVASTLEVEAPTTLLVPLTQHGLIASKRMGDGSNMTILDFIKTTSPWIKEIEPWQFCSGAGVGGTDRAVVYNKNPRKLWHEVPVEFQQEAPQIENFEIKVPCWAKSAGLIVPYPLSVTYFDGL